MEYHYPPARLTGEKHKPIELNLGFSHSSSLQTPVRDKNYSAKQECQTSRNQRTDYVHRTWQ
jgi:hypothetical protein